MALIEDHRSPVTALIAMQKVEGSNPFSKRNAGD
jgi:cell envelope opacity-associated protein A